MKDPEYSGCLVKDPEYSGSMVKDSSLIELRTTDFRSAFYFAMFNRLTFRIGCHFA